MAVIDRPAVELRDVREEDLPVLYEHQRDPVATTMAAFASRDWEPFVAHWKTKVLGNATAVTKAVLVRSTVAGYVASFDHADRRLVGYWIGREFWGKGVASAALAAFLEHERRRPLHAFVASANVASVRVLEKCGFVMVARERAEDGVEELLMRLGA